MGEAVITFNASTVTDTDRVYNIEVALPDNASAANPATFTVPTTVTIPAGSYQGFFTITGVDNNLVDATIKTFTMTVTNPDETFEYSDSFTATVNVFEVCTIVAPFLGEYAVSMPAQANTGTTLFDTTVILQEGDTPFERIINVESPYLDYGLPATEFVLSLACEATRFTNLPYDTGLACSEDTPNLIVGDDDDNSGTYNTDDDSSFTVRIIENTSSACNGSPASTTVTFTKVE
ncbi:hypothetical protein GWA97_04785 [Flavobacterium sp. LaA7.5]|nr:hypothetical protein [Flavobacterium salilacus subsp. altitudinum]